MWGPSASPRHQQAVAAWLDDIGRGEQSDDQLKQTGERIIAARMAELQAVRPLRLRGAYLARLRGVRSALMRGVVGDSRWGHQMVGKRGGGVMARHALEHLRRISPLGVRASVIARARRKVREAFERDRVRGR